MSFETTSELALLTEKELGHNLSGAASSQRADVVATLDESHKIVHAGGGILNYKSDGKRRRKDVTFSFARSQNPYVLTLIPSITTANVTATRNSNAVTFGADPNAGVTVQNYFIRIGGANEVYRIASHSAASTSATLDGAFVGAANVAAGTCEIFKLQYQVGSNDILQLISPIRCYGTEDEITLTDKDEMLDRSPLKNAHAKLPEYAAIVKENTGNVTIQLESYPQDLTRIEIDYIPIPTTLDTTSSDPTLPKQYRKVLAYLSAHYMAFRNGDNRAAAFLETARMLFTELVDWNERIMSAGDPRAGKILTRGPSLRKKKFGVQRSFD